MDIKVELRIPDASGYGLYVCRDERGTPYNFTPEQLKTAIARGQINLVNMKMSSNGALRYTPEYLKSIGIDENNIRNYEMDQISTRYNPGKNLGLLMSGCNGHKKILGKYFSYQMTLDYDMLAKQNIIQLNQNFAFFHYYAANILNSGGYAIGRVYYQIDRKLKYELSMIEIYDAYTNIFPNPGTSGIVYSESDAGIVRFIGLSTEALAKILHTVCNLPGGEATKPQLLGVDSSKPVSYARDAIFESALLDEDMTRLYRAKPDRPNIKVSNDNRNNPYLNTIMTRDYIFRKHRERDDSDDSASLVIDTPEDSLRNTQRLLSKSRGIAGIFKAFKR